MYFWRIKEINRFSRWINRKSFYISVSVNYIAKQDWKKKKKKKKDIKNPYGPNTYLDEGYKVTLPEHRTRFQYSMEPKKNFVINIRFVELKISSISSGIKGIQLGVFRPLNSYFGCI